MRPSSLRSPVVGLRVAALFAMTLLSACSGTKLNPSTVAGVSPGTGSVAGGTPVTIIGTNFTADSVVTFGGVPAASVRVTSSSSITATTAAHEAGPVDVVVSRPNRDDVMIAAGFTFIGQPPATVTTPTPGPDPGPVADPGGPVATPTITLSAVSPSSGPAAGGTAVTISGNHFVAGAIVTFGGTPAGAVLLGSASSITATVPQHAAGTVDVVVTNPGGDRATLSGAFTFTAAPPLSPTITLASVAPASGPSTGGTGVTLTGTHFAAGATVTFDGIPAPYVAVINATTIGATLPPHAAGAVEVAVINPDGARATLINGFTFIAPPPAPAPTLSSILPASGLATGGSKVTLTGNNFVTGAVVTFGGTQAVATVSSATSITATVPQHAAGAVDVTVANPDGGRATLTNGFTYYNQPTVSSISPNSGSTSGGTLVTITGSQFTAGATVLFGGVSATNVTVTSSVTIAAVTPSRAAGVVDVVVTNPLGLPATLASAFTYLGPPTITSVSPANGPLTGGNVVTIDGTNYSPGGSVLFGSLASPGVTFVSATRLTATVPASPGADLVGVSVSFPGGRSAAQASAYRYLVNAIGGKWNGPTSQGLGREIAFVVNGNSVTEISVKVAVPGCGEQVISNLRNEVPINGVVTNNAFSVSFFDRVTLGSIAVTGTFTSNTAASGTVSVLKPVECGGQSVSATWTATR